ncbi:MAG: response regulator [Geminicoccaceae bacterium]|nr:response regulator [Geminicoccaceae bacterium]
MARILVADDDDLIVDLVRFTLEAKGHEIMVANDGDEAIDIATTEEPELIILDGMMPGSDGLQVLRRLGQGGAPSVPVIMLSARKQQQDVVGGLELGAEDYLVKPFMPEELAMRVSKVLRARA